MTIYLLTHVLKDARTKEECVTNLGAYKKKGEADKKRDKLIKEELSQADIQSVWYNMRQYPAYYLAEENELHTLIIEEINLE